MEPLSGDDAEPCISAVSSLPQPPAAAARKCSELGREKRQGQRQAAGLTAVHLDCEISAVLEQLRLEQQALLARRAQASQRGVQQQEQQEPPVAAHAPPLDSKATASCLLRLALDAAFAVSSLPPIFP